MLRKLIAVAALSIAPCAFALNNRSAVSATGLDTNPCTTASPCRSFTAAMAATVADGEIIALTSAGYGSFTIDKGITVSGIPGVHAAITATTGDGIDVTTADDVNVVLRNLVLLGPVSAMGTSNGITVNTPSHVRMIGCVVRAFPNAGIQIYRGNATIDHCAINANSQGVFLVNTVPGSGTANATITNSLIEGNATGINMSADTQATVSGTTVALSTNGITLAPNANPAYAATVVVEKSVITGSIGAGLYLLPFNGNVTTAYVSDTLFENDNHPIYHPLGGTVYTFGNNEFANNSAAPDALTSVSLK
jgi:hypothetical protein